MRQRPAQHSSIATEALHELVHSVPPKPRKKSLKLEVQPAPEPIAKRPAAVEAIILAGGIDTYACMVHDDERFARLTRPPVPLAEQGACEVYLTAPGPICDGCHRRMRRSHGPESLHCDHCARSWMVSYVPCALASGCKATVLESVRVNL